MMHGVVGDDSGLVVVLRSVMMVCANSEVWC